MKTVFILTILITGYAHGFVSHEDYAISVELDMNSKLAHSKLVCDDLDNDSYYTCVLKRKDVATDTGYDYDYNYMKGYLANINKVVWFKYNVPELYVRRE